MSQADVRNGRKVTVTLPSGVVTMGGFNHISGSDYIAIRSEVGEVPVPAKVKVDGKPFTVVEGVRSGTRGMLLYRIERVSG